MSNSTWCGIIAVTTTENCRTFNSGISWTVGGAAGSRSSAGGWNAGEWWWQRAISAAVRPCTAAMFHAPSPSNWCALTDAESVIDRPHPTVCCLPLQRIKTSTRQRLQQLLLLHAVILEATDWRKPRLYITLLKLLFLLFLLTLQSVFRMLLFVFLKNCIFERSKSDGSWKKLNKESKGKDKSLAIWKCLTEPKNQIASVY